MSNHQSLVAARLEQLEREMNSQTVRKSKSGRWKTQKVRRGTIIRNWFMDSTSGVTCATPTHPDPFHQFYTVHPQRTASPTRNTHQGIQNRPAIPKGWQVEMAKVTEPPPDYQSPYTKIDHRSPNDFVTPQPWKSPVQISPTYKIHPPESAPENVIQTQTPMKLPIKDNLGPQPYKKPANPLPYKVSPPAAKPWISQSTYPQPWKPPPPIWTPQSIPAIPKSTIPNPDLDKSGKFGMQNPAGMTDGVKETEKLFNFLEDYDASPAMARKSIDHFDQESDDEESTRL